MRIGRLALAAACVACAHPLVAQGRGRLPPPERPKVDSTLITGPRPRGGGLGAIDGMVTDTVLNPLAGADITVFRTAVKVATGESGRFRITGVPAGQYVVIVRKLGYHPVSGVIQVAGHDTLRLAYELERLSMLDTVKVIEERRSFRMMEFEYRRSQGLGQFLGPDEIAKRNSVYATELIRGFRGIEVSMKAGGGGQMIYTALSKTAGSILSACYPDIWLDGVRMPGPFSLDLLPATNELSGIEVYAGPAETPMQYRGTMSCGAILVWTKDGSESPPTKRPQE